VIKVIKMFNTERHLNVYKIEEHIWLHETTYTSYPSLNPYLYDSDWDAAPEDAVVYEFIYDEVYDNVKERDKIREKVKEMNKLLIYGDAKMLNLVDRLVNNEQL
jgi:hypothetical protein